MWIMMSYTRMVDHMIMKLIFEHYKRNEEVEKKYVAIFKHYVFSILEFICYIEQVIF